MHTSLNKNRSFEWQTRNWVSAMDKKPKKIISQNLGDKREDGEDDARKDGL